MHIRMILYSLAILLFFSSPACAGQGLDFSVRDRHCSLSGLFVLKDGIPEQATALPAAGDPVERFRPLFLALDDPDTARLFSLLGVVTSWSSSGETLLLFSSGRNIYFDRSSCWYTYRGHEGRGGKGFVKAGGRAFISLGELFVMMNVMVQQKSAQESFTIIPVIDDLLWSEEQGTRDFLIHGTAPMECRVQESDDTHCALLFPGARSQLKEGEHRRMDMSVTVAQECPSGVRVTLRYPSSWMGKYMGGRLSGDVAMEMLPHFLLTAGYRSEKALSFSVKEEKGKTLVLVEATGPLQYIWNYSAAEKLLFIDIPLLETPPAVRKPFSPGGPLSGCRVCSFDKLYGVTRIYCTLSDNVQFSFEKDKKAPYTMRLSLRQGASGTSVSGRDVTGEAENWGTIVIDPGHGGCDPGAVNRTLGLMEKTVNLDVAFRLAALLEQSGWKVVLTRTTDRDVSWANSPDRVELQARVDVSTVNSASLFISIHCNAATSSSTCGSSLHWSKEEDYVVAQALVLSTEEFERVLGIPQRGIVQNDFYVLRHSTMPALLVEMAHISNPHEAEIFADGGCRQRLAEALARGIEKYFIERGYKKKGRSS